MKFHVKAAICILPLLVANAWGEESALTCSDFRPTPEALNRFPNLMGACEAVVERDGNLYGMFRAIVRRTGARSVTFYLPVTDHTFVVEPRPEARVLIDGSDSMRPPQAPGQRSGWSA